jgi:hypothetical protein
MPQFVAAGTVAVGTTGTITPTFPAGIAAFDVLFTVAESVGGSSYAVPAGWAQVTNSPVVQGTNTQLTVMWLRYTGSEVAQGLTGPTDHKIARTVAVRGLPRTGNPWNVLGTAVSAVSNTSASWPGATPTPTAVNTLVQEIIALTNATYTAITERVDNRTASGGGGSIAVISGAKATAAATGASTATLTTAATKAYMTLVLPDAPLPRPMRPPQVISQAVFRAANW